MSSENGHEESSQYHYDTENVGYGDSYDESNVVSGVTGTEEGVESNASEQVDTADYYQGVSTDGGYETNSREANSHYDAQDLQSTTNSTSSSSSACPTCGAYLDPSSHTCTACDGGVSASSVPPAPVQPPPPRHADRRHPGDWICPRCSENNFASRMQCYKRACATPRPADTMDGYRPAPRREDRRGDRDRDYRGPASGGHYQDRAGMHGAPGGAAAVGADVTWRSLDRKAICNALAHGDAGDWLCERCDNHNFASRETCKRCHQGTKSPDNQRAFDELRERFGALQRGDSKRQGMNQRHGERYTRDRGHGSRGGPPMGGYGGPAGYYPPQGYPPQGYPGYDQGYGHQHPGYGSAPGYGYPPQGAPAYSGYPAHGGYQQGYQHQQGGYGAAQGYQHQQGGYAAAQGYNAAPAPPQSAAPPPPQSGYGSAPPYPQQAYPPAQQPPYGQ